MSMIMVTRIHLTRKTDREAGGAPLRPCSALSSARVHAMRVLSSRRHVSCDAAFWTPCSADSAAAMRSLGGHERVWDWTVLHERGHAGRVCGVALDSDGDRVTVSGVALSRVYALLMVSSF